MSIIEGRALARSYGGIEAVRDLSFSMAEGECLGVIGPNGAGKTSLFNLIAGAERPDSGTVSFRGQDITRLGPERRARLGIIRTFQNGRTFANLSVEENLLLGAHRRRRAARAGFLAGAFLEVFEAFFPAGPLAAEEEDLRAGARAILARFGERLLPRSKEAAWRFSYANRRRIELARALAARPELLLLDEPTAGMNPAETLELVDFLGALKAEGLAIIVIEHKLPLIMKLCDRVIVMDEGEKIAEGRPDLVARDPRVVEAYLGRGAAAAWAGADHA